MLENDHSEMSVSVLLNIFQLLLKLFTNSIGYFLANFTIHLYFLASHSSSSVNLLYYLLLLQTASPQSKDCMIFCEDDIFIK